MQVSSLSSTIYADTFAQKAEQNTSTREEIINKTQDQPTQNSDQYRTVSTRTEQSASNIDQGERRLEITETKKTVEKHKIDLYA